MKGRPSENDLDHRPNGTVLIGDRRSVDPARTVVIATEQTNRAVEGTSVVGPDYASTLKLSEDDEQREAEREMAFRADEILHVLRNSLSQEIRSLALQIFNARNAIFGGRTRNREGFQYEIEGLLEQIGYLQNYIQNGEIDPSISTQVSSAKSVVRASDNPHMQVERIKKILGTTQITLARAHKFLGKKGNYKERILRTNRAFRKLAQNLKSLPFREKQDA